MSTKKRIAASESGNEAVSQLENRIYQNKSQSSVGHYVIVSCTRLGTDMYPIRACLTFSKSCNCMFKDSCKVAKNGNPIHKHP